MHYSIDTLPMLSLRMLFSLPFYVVILLWHYRKNEVSIAKKDWLSLWLLGVVGYYLASLFDFWGLKYITASIERLVLFIYPTIVLVISAIFLGKKISKIQYISLVLCYIGIVVAYIPDIKPGASANLWLGSFLIFLSAFTYAVYVVGSGQMVAKLGATVFTSYAMIFSTLMIVIHHVGSGSGSLLHFPGSIYIWTFIMAVFCTVIPSYLVSWGIKMVGANNSAIIGSIGPLSTIILASIFLGESLNAWQIFATFLILFGVINISIKK